MHHRKLCNLWRQQRACGSNSIENLSNKQLSIPEEEVLRFGLDHHVLPRKIDQDTVKISLERLLYSFKNKLHISSIDDEIKTEIKYIFRMFIIDAKQQCDKRHNQFIHRTFSSLSHNPKIKMCKFDKGKGVAVLNSKDYYAKLDVIVNDTSKFVKIINLTTPS